MRRAARIRRPHLISLQFSAVIDFHGDTHVILGYIKVAGLKVLSWQKSFKGNMEFRIAPPLHHIQAF